MKFIYNGKGNSRKSGIYKIINIQNGRIYIGSAKEFKSRARQHFSSLRNNKHQNKFLQNDFNKCEEEAFEFHVILITEGNTEERRKVEQDCISEQLDNWENCYNFKKKTAKKDGPWSNTPEETSKLKSENMKKRWQDPEYKKQVIQKIKENHQCDEVRQKISKASKKMWSDPERKKEISQKISEAYQNPEIKEKISKASKKNWQDPEYQEKVSRGLKQVFKDPKYAKKRSKVARKNWEDPFLRETMIKAMVDRWKNPEYKKKVSQNISNAFKKPIARQKKSEASKRMWKNPGHRERHCLAISKPIEQWSKDGKELIKIFPSATEAAKILNCSSKHIRECCCGRKKTAYGFIWKDHLPENAT